MEHYKISKLLNDSTVSKFVTKKWIGMHDLPSGQYSVNKNIGFETSVLTSYLCDYSDNILLKKEERLLNEIMFLKQEITSCISKINKTFIDSAEKLDIALTMHNLLEYNDNYSLTSGSFEIIIEMK